MALLAFLVNIDAAICQENLPHRQIVKLDEEGVHLGIQGKWNDAIPILQRAYSAAKVSEPGSGITLSLARNLGVASHHLGRYDDALLYEDEAIEISSGNSALHDPSLEQLLQDAETSAEAAGKLDRAEGYERRRASALKDSKGRSSSETLEALDKLGYLLMWEFKFDEAEIIFTDLGTIRTGSDGQSRDSLTLLEMGRLRLAQSRFEDAVNLLEQGLAVDDAVRPKPEKKIITDLAELARAYSGNGQPKKSLETEDRLIELYSKVYPNDRQGLTYNLMNFASIAREQGEFGHAEQILESALKPAPNGSVLDSGYALKAKTELAGCYIDSGLYEKGVSLLESLRADYANWPIDTRIAIDRDLASGIALQGRFTEAEGIIMNALNESQVVPNDYHPDRRDAITGIRASLMTQLGDLLSVTGKKDEAGHWFEQSLAEEKNFSSSRGDRGGSRRIVATFYMSQGQFQKADALLKEGLEFDRLGHGDKSYAYALSLETLGDLRRLEHRYEDANTAYQESLAILERTVGPIHPEAGRVTDGLGRLAARQGNVDLADKYFQNSLSNLRYEFKILFPGMSERDRLQFQQRMVERLAVYYSFVLHNSIQAELIAHAYDLALWQKGLVARSMSSLRDELAHEMDKNSEQLWDQLVSKRSQIATLSSAAIKASSSRGPEIVSLETQANQLERELSKSLPDNQFFSSDVTAKDVRAQLKPDEAAIELLKFRENDGEHPKNSFHYVALVLRSGDQQVRLVDLGVAKDFEERVLSGYHAAIGFDRLRQRGLEPVPVQSPHVDSDPLEVTRAFWEPLKPNLVGVRRVFVSADGILNTINIGMIPTNKSTKLMESVDLRLVNSTRDLLATKREESDRTAVLLGAPDFDLDSNLESVSPTDDQIPAPRSRDLYGSVLDPLPGTADEVTTIGKLVNDRGWQVRSFVGALARKTAVTSIHHPRILHIATHGFFFEQTPGATGESSGYSEDPMLRSGLFFAGANQTLKGKSPVGDDGVLTASEAMDLDLRGTELVVLSACDTGLGTVQNGEGVFGLRRALEVAGTHSILMSLWAVPDQETKELMTRFYQYWLDGMEKHDALRKAQLEVRDQVVSHYGSDIPYYWGAFVLVGE